jgi:hypothetical protein
MLHEIKGIENLVQGIGQKVKFAVSGSQQRKKRITYLREKLL